MCRTLLDRYLTKDLCPPLRLRGTADRTPSCRMKVYEGLHYMENVCQYKLIFYSDAPESLLVLPMHYIKVASKKSTEAKSKIDLSS